MYWLIGRNYKLSIENKMLHYENNNKTNLDIWSGNLGMRQQIQYFDTPKKSVKDAMYDY
jgi:hypothetical protein